MHGFEDIYHCLFLQYVTWKLGYHGIWLCTPELHSIWIWLLKSWIGILAHFLMQYTLIDVLFKSLNGWSWCWKWPMRVCLVRTLIYSTRTSNESTTVSSHQMRMKNANIRQIYPRKNVSVSCSGIRDRSRHQRYDHPSNLSISSKESIFGYHCTI